MEGEERREKKRETREQHGGKYIQRREGEETRMEEGEGGRERGRGDRVNGRN